MTSTETGRTRNSLTRAAVIDAVHDFADRVAHARMAPLPRRRRGFTPGYRTPDARLRAPELRVAADNLITDARTALSADEADLLQLMVTEIFWCGDYSLLWERTDRDLYTLWRDRYHGAGADSGGKDWDSAAWRARTEKSMFTDMPTLRWVRSPWHYRNHTEPGHDGGLLADRAAMAAAFTALAHHTAPKSGPTPSWRSYARTGGPARPPRLSRAWGRKLQQLLPGLAASLNIDHTRFGGSLLTAGERARADRVLAALVQLEYVTEPAEIWDLVLDPVRFEAWARDRRAGFGSLAAEQLFADLVHLDHVRSLPVTERGLRADRDEFADLLWIELLYRLDPRLTGAPLDRAGLRAAVTALADIVYVGPGDDGVDAARVWERRIQEQAEQILAGLRRYGPGTGPDEPIRAEERRAEHVLAFIVTNRGILRAPEIHPDYTPARLAEAVFDPDAYEQLLDLHNAMVIAERRRVLDIDNALPDPDRRHWTNAAERVHAEQLRSERAAGRYCDLDEHGNFPGAPYLSPVALGRGPHRRLDLQEATRALRWLAGHPDTDIDRRAETADSVDQFRHRIAAEIVHSAHTGLFGHPRVSVTQREFDCVARAEAVTAAALASEPELLARDPFALIDDAEKYQWWIDARDHALIADALGIDDPEPAVVLGRTATAPGPGPHPPEPLVPDPSPEPETPEPTAQPEASL